MYIFGTSIPRGTKIIDYFTLNGDEIKHVRKCVNRQKHTKKVEKNV